VGHPRGDLGMLQGGRGALECRCVPPVCFHVWWGGGEPQMWQAKVYTYMWI
jgi:hypothetical protein